MQPLPPGRTSTAAWLVVTLMLGGFNSGQQAEATTPSEPVHYAFRSLARPTLPQLDRHDRVRTPIDAFALSQLEAAGLTLAPEADRTTLLRRLFFDLVGLPPTPEEAGRFLQDDTDDAYERLVDYLLASSHFGERWGQHWLDAAGYVDVYGIDENCPTIRIPPGGWKYRDYVVQSLNEDKPYDRFLIEQLAGDELFDWREAEGFTNETRQLLIATGFLRTAADDTDQEVLRLLGNFWGVVFDQVQIFGTCVMGLTMQCARCHEHKYDPISQEDYYRLAAHFTPAYNPDNWVPLNERTLPDVPPKVQAEIAAHNAAIDERIKPLKEKIVAALRPARDRVLAKRLAELPEAIRVDVKIAIDTPKEDRSTIQEFLYEKLGKQIEVIPDDQSDAELTDQERAQVVELRSQIAAEERSRRGHDWIQTLYDVGEPHDTRILARGEITQPADAVRYGLPRLFADGRGGNQLTLKPQGKTSGRRLEIAQRLTDSKSQAGGLVSRVMVNRVWHHLFGRGIVATPGNLGGAGDRPTHPQLLEWLASEFAESGWRLKPLLRQILLSSVYRQASEVAGADASYTIDPDNHLLWHMPLKRLEAEIVRDAVLATSGRLDRSEGGPSVPLVIQGNGEVAIAEGNPTPTSHYRRTIYITSRRNYHPAMLGNFDAPVMATNCTCRDQSTVVTQSLTLLNDKFMLDQADYFAERVTNEVANSFLDRVDYAFRLAYQRPPTSEEALWSATLLLDQRNNYEQSDLSPADRDQKSLASLCHMLLCSSEFLYVE